MCLVLILILLKATTGQSTSKAFCFWYSPVYSVTVSAFIRTNVCLKPHVSVANGPMPVVVMIHRLIDKTFWASVAFGILDLATSECNFKSPLVQSSWSLSFWAPWMYCTLNAPPCAVRFIAGYRFISIISFQTFGQRVFFFFFFTRKYVIYFFKSSVLVRILFGLFLCVHDYVGGGPFVIRDNKTKYK